MKKVKKIVIFTLMFSLALPVFAADTISTSTDPVLETKVKTNTNTSSSTTVLSPETKSSYTSTSSEDVVIELQAAIPSQTINGTATGTVKTKFVKNSAGGAAPVVKAKWEMNTIKDNNGKYTGTDDTTKAGAQFMPSGKYQVNKNIAVCAIVSDPDGMVDLNGVYADISYPQGVNVDPNNSCGSFLTGITLKKISKEDGINLACNQIKNNNNNLPAWNSSYDYDEVCALGGELLEEAANVFCGEASLAYNSPSGDYKVAVSAQDKNGLGGSLENIFNYMDLTAFETDFSAVNYGDVKLNTHKTVYGDLAWGGLPSVRNTGNTRVNIKVMQNDMGLGMTDGKWNVKWDARVGADGVFKSYSPDYPATLSNSLNLGETDQMDFSILISRFPTNGKTFSGNMTLSASKAAHLSCN